MLSSANINRVKIDSDYLKDECINELYKAFEKFNRHYLEASKNALNDHNESGWNWPLVWAGFEPEKDKKTGKWYFGSQRLKKEKVYINFSYVPVATGSGYSVPHLDFYLKSEEGYEWFNKLPKDCIEWKIRDLCKKTDKEPDK